MASLLFRRAAMLLAISSFAACFAEIPAVSAATAISRAFAVAELMLGETDLAELPAVRILVTDHRLSYVSPT